MAYENISQAFLFSIISQKSVVRVGQSVRMLKSLWERSWVPYQVSDGD